MAKKKKIDDFEKTGVSHETVEKNELKTFIFFNSLVRNARFVKIVVFFFFANFLGRRAPAVRRRGRPRTDLEGAGGGGGGLLVLVVGGLLGASWC